MSAKSDMIRRCFGAYRDKDREALENLLSDDFTFTSPYDDGINKATYFVRCWPNSEKILRHDLERIVEFGDEAFVLYTCLTTDGTAVSQHRALHVRTGPHHGGKCLFWCHVSKRRLRQRITSRNIQHVTARFSSGAAYAVLTTFCWPAQRPRCEDRTHAASRRRYRPLLPYWRPASGRAGEALITRIVVIPAEVLDVPTSDVDEAWLHRPLPE